MIICFNIVFSHYVNEVVRVMRVAIEGLKMGAFLYKIITE